ncbi:MAG: bifunctional heptose 7-phosphate kinase/heptose 1-phosphate adenyltransferase, partial [Deltaproteobacteria bacterium]|nr:bifunctional heptose 7-phosphate kinase/heptose 1-phosphate adenyltransferase [Deltaproteobacteria bacterium]
IECVDMVVIFEEDTPLNLIQSLKPDILVKGGDYTRETVVGYDLVESWGGEVVLVSLKQGKSTTEIVNQIKKK